MFAPHLLSQRLAVMTISLVVLTLLPLSDAVNIHLVPHSHDDVGWLKTPAQYYYGWNNSIQHANVQLIYTSTIDALLANSSRTFIAVEMAFFSKWYFEQPPTRRDDVKRLVASGQLQFAGGGWCSHDEATTTYQDMLEQMTVGQQFILAEFGVDALPRIQWQVDPFGHSAGQVMILSQSSDVEALYFSRIDYQDFSDRQHNQKREFFWMPSPSLGEKAVVFTSMMLHGTYCPPIDMNFDILLNEPTVVDRSVCSSSAASLTETLSTAAACSDPQNTALSWVDRLAAMVGSDWDVSSSDNIMWTMGCDFTYMQAETWFGNMDRIRGLIGRENASSLTVDASFWASINFSYATPQSYTNARLADILRSAQQQDIGFETTDTTPPLGVKEGDFFPYADGPHMFWTGYFSSRPTFKRLVRIASGVLAAIHQASAAYRIGILNNTADINDVNDTLASAIHMLRQAVAQSQHHDAVTGTAKQHVSFDYTKTLTAALDAAIGALANLLSLNSEGGASYQTCLLSNESVCAATVAVAPFHVFGWNSRDGASSIGNGVVFEIPVSHEHWTWTAMSPEGTLIPVNSVVVPSPAPCLSLSGECAPWTAILKLENPPQGGAFILSAAPSSSPSGSSSDDDVRFGALSLFEMASSGVVETDAIKLVFDGTTGELRSMTNKRDNVERNVTLTICYYVGSTGNQQSRQASGAYIFRPVGSECIPVTSSNASMPAIVTVVLSASPTVAIVFDQNITEWLSLRWFVFSDEPRVEVEVSMNELPISSAAGAPGQGRELVLRWSTSINNTDDTFWTDSNGLELQPRRRNTSPHLTEPVAGNYFPVPVAALIRDATAEWLVVPDATVGCASLERGSLECMFHRRLLVDDGRGVGEALNETEFITPYTNCAWCREDLPLGCCGTHYGRPMPLRRKWIVSLHSPSNTTWRRFSQSLRRHPLLLLSAGEAPGLNMTTLVSRLFPNTWDTRALPPNVSLDSIEASSHSGADMHRTLWIRLAHIGSCFCSASCVHGSAVVNMTQLFPGAIEVTRTTLLFTKRWELASNRTSSAGRVSGAWDSETYARPVGDLQGTIVTMYPMEVHAYMVRFG
jgi:lysosomal alpha-mannosidase